MAKTKFIRRGRLQNWKRRPEDFEPKSTLPSETVPDQAISISELLRRHLTGTLVDVAAKVGYFNEDDGPLDHDSPDMEKLRHLDLQEKHEFINANKQGIIDLKKRKLRNDRALALQDEAKFADKVKKLSPPKDEPVKTKKGSNEPQSD